MWWWLIWLTLLFVKARMSDFILIIKNTERKNIENKLISFSSFQLTRFSYLSKLYPLCIILLINLSIGFTICSRRVIDIFQGNAWDSLYVVKKWHKFVLLIQKRVFFLWHLSIKNNIVLYHMDSAPLYHVDFPQLHHIGFHDIYYIA